MKTYRGEGKRIRYTNTGTAISSGDVVALGAVIGIAVTDIAATTGVGMLEINGEHSLTATTAESWSAGDVLYWNTSTKMLTDTAQAILAGHAAADKAALATTATVILGRTVLNATISDSVVAKAIAGGDSSMAIDGMAGSASAGGAVPITGGAGNGAGNAGGAVLTVGGAGVAAAGGTGGVGGAVSSTGGAAGGDTTGTGGAGGAADRTGGAGGACSGAGTGGAGGSASNTGGVGGAAATTGTGGAGGTVSMIGGVGGATATGVGGAGASVNITAGAGGTASGAGTSGAGGSIILTAGASAAGGGTAGVQGMVRVLSRMSSKGTVTAKTTAATLTIAELLTGLLTGTHTAGATQAYTLPTGTAMSAGCACGDGEGFEWTLINLSTAAADSITVTAGTDHTIVGAPIVISVHSTTGGAITSMGNASSRWYSRKTTANTWVTYRLG